MDDLTAVPPGPWVADDRQVSLDDVIGWLDGLQDNDLADALTDLVRGVRRAEALVAAAVVAVHDRVVDQGCPISGATATVAVLTGKSNRGADYAIDAAATVCSEPVVWAALAEGRIDTARARAIAEGLAEVPAVDRAALVARAVDYAQEHTAYQTRRHVSRLLVDYDPELAGEQVERQRAKAWDKRHIGVDPRPHGMVEIFGCLPAGTARILLTALDKVADGYHDGRTRDQKRVDALAEILAEHVKVEITVDVVIPADTLAGLRNGGASVAGIGPVDADDARAMALSADARWRGLIVDPLTGRLDRMSTSAYEIPDRLRAAVRARDRRCRFPGCSTDAARTDTDHVVEWPRGTTSGPNLAPGCRTHHRVKTFSGWECHSHPDGSLVWISPLGTQHITFPWDYNNPEY